MNSTSEAFKSGKRRFFKPIIVSSLCLLTAACSNSANKPAQTETGPVDVLSSISQPSTVDGATGFAAPTKRPTLEVLSGNEVQNTDSAGQNFAALTRTPSTSNFINNQTKFSSKTFGVAGSPRVTTSATVRKGGGRYHVGKPYTIRGIRYVPKEDPNYRATGLASWYGPNFHGRLTANGEIYDQFALSAAHPTMPLPSYAKVTNLENGASVIVRVNDRGPFSKKRIIDLSSRAAQLLGYTKKGVAKVRVEYAGRARMDGLDEQQLLASYNPGSLNPNTIVASRPTVVASNTITAKPVAKPATAPVQKQTAQPRKPLDAFDAGRFGAGSVDVLVLKAPTPKALVNGYLPSGTNHATAQAIAGITNAEAGSEAALLTIQIGSIETEEQLFVLEDKILKYGPVSVVSHASGYTLQATIETSNLDKVRALLK